MKRTGRRLRTEHLEVRVADSLFPYVRVAVVVGKHGHLIVQRNRLRRRLRELVRVKMMPSLGKVDLVIRSLPCAYEATFDQLIAEVEELAGQLLSRRGT